MLERYPNLSTNGAQVVSKVGIRCAPCSKEPATTQPNLLFINDPSAGSPTETLLRLLLPLNDQV
jgi:hypothetical protein